MEMSPKDKAKDLVVVNSPEYQRIHWWIKKHYGKPSVCSFCNKADQKRYEWALLKDKNHEKNIDNYIRLCHSCHVKYDYTDEQREKQSKTHKGKKMSDEAKENMSKGMKGRIPWNKGKRKPIVDDLGKKWCNCVTPKLTSSGVNGIQAYCLKCGEYWYN